MSLPNPLFIAPSDPQTLDAPEPPARTDTHRLSLQMEIRGLAARALDSELSRNERTFLWRQLRSKCQKIAPLLENNEERELCQRVAFYGQPARNELPSLSRARLRMRPKPSV